MGKEYQISGKNDSRELAKFLAANGQGILPMVELIEECKIAVDDLLEVLGRSTLEAVLQISAACVAGESHRGRLGGEFVRHGVQDGVVSLSNRKMRVSRPRPRNKRGGAGSGVYRPGTTLGFCRTLASWFERDHPGAAASLREGLSEMFTINRLGLPPSLRRSLGTTNIIESPNSGVRMKTRRVTNWRDGSMVPRWAASGLLASEKNFRRIMGYSDLWILAAALDRGVDREGKAA